MSARICSCGGMNPAAVRNETSNPVSNAEKKTDLSHGNFTLLCPTRSLFQTGCFKIVNENSVAAAGRFLCLRGLKCEEASIVAHDRIGRFVTGIIAEKSQPFIIAGIVEIQLPDI